MMEQNSKRLGFQMERIDTEHIHKQIASAFGGEFMPDNQPGTTSWPPAFIHEPSGQRFRYIPGGQFRMGLSEGEEAAARKLCNPFPANIGEMRPVRLIKISPFLMGERPVLTRELGGETGNYPNAAAYVSFDTARKHAHRYGMTLPSEAQWEYACRAGTETLFTFGDRLPEESELAEWLTFDFSAGYGRANGFGMYGLFIGEWCSDVFTDSYEPDLGKSNDGPRVVRGGGAYFWPWQDQEWVWCMSAMRCPSTDLPDGECGFRFVRNLPDS
ncbi:formylglycine-generating enzyme family protein [Brevibacillus sp. B_LB10_24]|uniref:formylglycine-generating enzyme family protein n=1 Tax=Brevibacillus sp. B_LB10_24 TaxID=3380645 RepID=UPI0038B7B9B2